MKVFVLFVIKYLCATMSCVLSCSIACNWADAFYSACECFWCTIYCGRRRRAVLCIAFSVASYAIQWSVRDNAPLIAIPVGSASDPAATLEMVKCRRIILCCCCFFSISCSLKKHKLLKRNWWPLYTAVACLVYMHAWWWWWWCGETRKCMWAKLYTNSTYIYKVYIYF